MIALIAWVAAASAGTVTWTGMGDGLTWADGGNWSNANFMPSQPVPPGSGDAVVIAGAGLTEFSAASPPTAVASITLSGGRTLRTTGSSLSVAGDINLSAAGNTLHLNGGALAVAGEVRSGTVLLNGGALVGPVTFRTLSVSSQAVVPGEITLLGAIAWSGPVFAGQALTLEAHTGLPSTLTASGSVNNAGQITLTSTAPSGSAQIVTNLGGTFTNQGTMTMAAGAGGDRTVSGNFRNTGTLTIAHPTQMATLTAGVTYSNSGAISITGAGTLTVGGLAPTFNQTAGSIDGVERFTAQFAQVNWTGGTLSNTDATPASPLMVAGRLTLNDAVIQAFNVRINSLVEFPGNLRVGQTITVIGQSGNNGVLRLLNNLTNAGTIILTSTSAGQANVNYVGAGRTITNTATGVIRFEPGAGGMRNLGGSLNNAGQVLINTPTNWAYNGGVYTNTGTLDVAPGATLNIAASGQILNANAGLIRGADRILLTGMFFFLNGGVIENAPGQVGGPTMNGCQIVLVSPTPLNANLFGPCTLSSNLAAGQTLNVTATDVIDGVLTPANSLTNAGTIVLNSTGARPAEIRFSAANRSVTNTTTGSIIVRRGGGGARTIAANLINNGLVRLETPTAFSYAGGAYLNLGTLELSPDATLSVSGHYSGPGVLALQPGPDVAGQPCFPSINVASGNYTIEGTLRINPVGQEPPLGSVQPLITGPFTGGWAAYDVPLIPGSLVTTYSLSPDPGALSVRRRACSADYNADGAPDQEDLSSYITDYFAEPFPGWANGGNSFAVPCPTQSPPLRGGIATDFNADCDLNQEDLSVFITAYFLDAESCSP